MKAIVAVDSNWGIGYRGNLLQRIPADMKFFKQMTLGKVVVMGRETFESFPGQEPLKDRINIVLSKTFVKEQVTVCHSLDELFAELKQYSGEDVFVIGGESVFSQLLPYCTEAFVTKIMHSYIADKHFRNLDKEAIWRLISESDLQTYKDIQFKFTRYVNGKVGIYNSIDNFAQFKR